MNLFRVYFSLSFPFIMRASRPTTAVDPVLTVLRGCAILCVCMFLDDVLFYVYVSMFLKDVLFYVYVCAPVYVCLVSAAKSIAPWGYK